MHSCFTHSKYGSPEIDTKIGVSNTARQYRKHGTEAIPRRFLYAAAIDRSVFDRLLWRDLRLHVPVHKAHHALEHVAGL
jgi:hypothetical protein